MKNTCKLLLAPAVIAAAFATASQAALPAFKVAAAPGLVSPATADSYYCGTSSGCTAAGTADLWASGYPVEITTLAQSLHNNVDLIYEYVRNNIETAPMYGLQKGALGALIDQSGTDFDQAELMVDLLRASGYTASYQAGTVTLSGAQAQTWFGNVTDAASLAKILADGGIPASVTPATGTVSSVTLATVWVQVSINGTSYVFDPSFKPHSYTAGINLNTAMGYSDSGLMSAAQTGMTSGTANDSTGTVSVPYVSNVNIAGIQSTLSGYANNLVAYLKANTLYPNGEPYAAGQIDDIIGRQDITQYVTPSGGLRITSLTAAPYSFSAATAQHTWSGDLPDAYRTTLEVKWDDTSTTPATVLIDRKFFADQIYGRRLEFEFLPGPSANTSDGMQVALAIDHTLVPGTQVYTVASANGVLWPASPALVMNIDHPYAAAGPSGSAGTYMDQTEALGNQFSEGINFQSAVEIVAGFGEVSERLYSKLSTEGGDDAFPAPQNVCSMTNMADTFAVPIACGSNSNEKAVRPWLSAHALTYAQIGADWMAQYSRMAKLQAAIGDGVVQTHHLLGAVYNAHLLFTNPANVVSVEPAISLNSKTGSATQRQAMGASIASAADALEGSVFEQQMNSTDGTSVSSRFDWYQANCNSSSGFGSYNCPNTASPRFYLLNANANFAGLFPAQNPTNNSPSNFSSIFNTAQPYLLDTTVSGLGSGQYSMIIADASYAGPGNYCGAAVPLSPSPKVPPCGQQSGVSSSLRGGALLAFGTTGNQLSFANIVAGTAGGLAFAKGGGGSDAPVYNKDYDPAGTAQLLKDSFKDRSKQFGVDLKTGQVSYTAPEDITVGNGGFPYSLSLSRTFSAGNATSTGMPNGWSHNLDERIKPGSSGMAIMGDGPVVPSTSSLVAFYVSQQIYATQPSTPSALLTRWVTEPFVERWWTGQILHNAVSVTSGLSMQQYVRLPIANPDCQYAIPANCTPSSFTFNPPSGYLGSGPNWVLAQSGQPTSVLDFNGQTWGQWDDSSVGFTLTSPQKDQRSYAYWGLPSPNMAVPATIFSHGWHLTTWSYPQGVSVTYSYNDSNNDMEALVNDPLTTVTNSLGRSLTLNYPQGVGVSPPAGECNLESVSDSAGRSASFGCATSSQSMTSVSTPAGNLYQYSYFGPFSGASDGVEFPENSDGTNYNVLRYTACQSPVAGSRPYCYPLLNQAYLPSDTVNPKEAFGYDANLRVLTYQDADSILYPSQRGPYQFFITGGSRGERMDPLGYSYAVYYDRWGRGIEYIDELGRTSTATYDGINRAITRTAPLGGQTLLSYDWLGNVTSLQKIPYSTTPVTATIPALTATYDANCGKIGSLTDAKGNVTLWSYDPAKCWLNSVTQPAVVDAKTGNTTNPLTQYSYTTYGLKLTVTDPTGLQAKYGYDNAWNPTTRTVDPTNLALTTSFYYDGGSSATTAGTGPGNVTTAIDPRGNASTYTYDNDRRVKSVTAPSATCSKTENTYTGELLTSSRQAKKCSPNESDTSTVSDSDWAVTSTAYSPDGKPLAVTDPSGDLALSWYDADDRATDSIACLTTGNASFTNPLLPTCPGASRITHSAYDAAGEVTNVYKGWGRPGQITYATYHYNLDGAQDWVKDADAHQTTNVLDGYDRLYQLQFPDASYEQYAYDNNGNLVCKRNRDSTASGANCSLFAAGTTITTVFDALNRETSRSVPANALGHFQRSLSTSYDLASRKWNLGLSDTETGTTSNQTLYNRYDTAGRLTSVDDSYLTGLFNSTCTPGTSRCFGSVGATYDAASNLATQTLYGAGGTTSYTETYSYDPLNRFTGLTGEGIPHASYLPYDALGRPTSATWGNTTQTGWAFQDDGDMTGLSHTIAGAVTSWTLNHDGSHQIVAETLSDNTLEMKAASTATSYTINNLNQYTAVGSTTPAYDKNGNLTGNGAWTYEYDEENRLRKATGPNTVLYDYDPAGRRRSKSVNGILTYYTSDGAEEVAEWGGTGALTTRYLNGTSTDDHIAMLDYTCGSPPCRYYYHPDWHGTTMMLSNATNGVYQKYSYDPYGVESSSDPVTGNPFRYTGRRLDAETGLYYYRARYYSTTLGRFLQTDPIGSKADLELYAYTYDDPLNATDPTGNSPLEIAFLVADTVQLGAAISSGEGLGMAITNEVVDIAGVASPVPGLSEAAHAIEGAAKVAEVGEKGAEVYRGSKLARNMEKAGNPVKKGEQQAHHIVAQNAKAAAPAQKAMAKAGVDINDAKNGAAMSKDAHQSVHTADNYSQVNAAMTEAAKQDNPAEAVGKVLDSFRQDLQSK